MDIKQAIRRLCILVRSRRPASQNSTKANNGRTTLASFFTEQVSEIARLFHSCSNDKVAEAALVSLRGAFAKIVAVAAARRGLPQGRFAAELARDFERHAGTCGLGAGRTGDARRRPAGPRRPLRYSRPRPSRGESSSGVAERRARSGSAGNSSEPMAVACADAFRSRERHPIFRFLQRLANRRRRGPPLRKRVGRFGR